VRLKGKTAIVTGGGSGLGKAFATRLAADGADIVIADLANAEAAAAVIGKDGVRAIGVAADVSKEQDVARIAEAAHKAFGRIDILINNAAYFSSAQHGPFDQIGLDEWRKMLDVNVLGMYLCCRAAVPHMKKQGGGRIVNLSSGTVLHGRPNFIHYVTSKGAVIAFTRALARELGKDGITVNAIAPGLTLSEGVLKNYESLPQNSERSRRERAIPRDEHPEDLIGTVSFLASDDAAFITGQTLAVDGGSAML
jgi:NAD(P)-dependent dehydrogenase (short-subunit alcohol dehydrogenase family)